MDIQKYLEHIQAERRNELSLAYLSHLQKQQVLHVHFENLDILAKKPLSLREEDLFQKIVHAKKGGVCYELNGIFYFLLKELGYEPYLMAGTVYVGNGVWALENAHLFIIVPLDNKEYLVDVGTGGNSPRLPVPLSGGEVVDSDGMYRVYKDETKALFYLQKKSDEEWETQYRFETPSHLWNLENIHPICVQTETSPKSMFNKMYFLSRVTENGRITLLGNTLIIVNGKEKTKRKLEEHEIEETVRRYFQIEI
ncbi:acetyltransferase [Brevibacillus sp. HB1.2]|uniref:arylamine N-acetyltransferase family protein n=1 Tax=unclassified Brevibacillus TaxID=2684853 RepID=UPI00156AE810|nr:MULTISPECIES: arylamine N-acetyltransferase [unclassified Brevibacillus]NRS19292.1 arylamine N-acetyltransferase [Brevibacillus sp. HB1.4B]NTU22686.1 acetyltransferase [Brevibacillus sp. HB1.2]